MKKVQSTVGLPAEAWKELKKTYVVNLEFDTVEVIADPQLEGVFGVQVTVYGKKKAFSKRETFQLLWTNDQWKQFDEVEFTTWPPTSGTLQFF
jgi:hypothetical protein